MKSKTDRKRENKTVKVVKKVSQDYGIEWSQEPTKIILVCNAGLMTESSYEQLLELFSGHGSVEDIRMIPQKSFSFVAFHQVDSSVEAMYAINGKLGLFIDPEKVLYLAHVNKMPDVGSGDDTLQRQWKSAWPKGLVLVTGFLDRPEAEAWVESVQGCWSEDSGMKHRQVTHFGYEFNYDINNIDKQKGRVSPFPDVWVPSLQRAVSAGYLPEMPDQCTVNRYQPGQGIPAHVDTHSCCTSHIASVSLVSDTTMDFSHLSNGEDSVSIRLTVGSLLVMSETARYAYSHGIVPRKHDIVPVKTQDMDGDRLTLVPRGTRVSFTFRKTLEGHCRCSFPQFCDSQRDQRITMDDEKARALEKAHVHQVYEEIADHFSHTRHSPWPRVLHYIDQLPPGGLLIDVGCGNGKYLDRNSNLAKSRRLGLIEEVKRVLRVG